MTEKIIIAGAGGQGIILLGKILAEAGMRQDRYVCWLPSYGAEVRGGSCFCMVTISDEQISSPYIDKADTLIIFNQPSLKRFLLCLRTKGLLILNRSLASLTTKTNKFKIISFPFTELAIKLGNIKVANTVALGVYLKQKSILKIDTVFKTLEEMAPEDRRELLEINLKALKEGIKIG